MASSVLARLRVCSCGIAAWQDFADDDHEMLQRVLESARTLKALTDGGAGGGSLRDGFSRQAAPSKTPGRTRPPAAAANGYRRAEGVRNAIAESSWKLGRGAPLRGLCELVEDGFGVLVVAAPMLTTGATAASIRDAEGAAAIVLNSASQDWQRNPAVARVHVAHELCHILFDPGDEGVQLVLDRDEEHPAGAAEQRAKAFAAELLIPKAGLCELFGSPRAIVARDEAARWVERARDHFGTPWQIAAHHMINRGFVARALEDWLPYAVPSPAVAPVVEGLPQPGGPSAGLLRALRVAWEAGRITDGQVRVALGLDATVAIPFG